MYLVRTSDKIHRGRFVPLCGTRAGFQTNHARTLASCQARWKATYLQPSRLADEVPCGLYSSS